MIYKPNTAIQAKSGSTQTSSTPAHVTKGLSPAAAQRLQRLVESSNNLQRLAYGEESEKRR